jgi:glycosyltransferase involved in cell wall biosynthesis
VEARYPDVALSVVLPAYNEAANIRTALPRAIASLRSMVGTFEIILIDDASTDDTLALARAVDEPELVVLSNERNLRQGGTLKRGFALARFALVTHNALDFPFDFDDLPLLLDRLPDADVVVARRETYPGTSAARRSVSWVNRKLLRALFAVPVSDYNFVQIYRKSVLDAQSSFSDATSFITAETIIRAHRSGARVVEVEVPYHRRVTGKPSSATASNITKALRDMVRLRRELARSPGATEQ